MNSYCLRLWVGGLVAILDRTFNSQSFHPPKITVKQYFGQLDKLLQNNWHKIVPFKFFPLLIIWCCCDKGQVKMCMKKDDNGISWTQQQKTM